LASLNLNAGNGNVTLTAGGAIADTDTIADITATTVTINAAGAFGADGAAIDTAVTHLNVSTTNSDQFIDEADGLASLNLNAGGGNVTLEASGAIADTDTAADIRATTATVTINATGAFGADGAAIDTAVTHLNVSTTDSNQYITEANGLANLNLNAGAGNVKLTVSMGGVADSDGDVGIAAAAATVSLLDTVKVGFGDSSNAINTSVSDLSVDTSAGNGNQYITEANGLTALNLNAGNGNVTLTVTAGSVTDGDATADITGGVATVRLLAMAKAGFGDSTNAINTSVSDLTVDTSAGTGNQFIDEADGLANLNLNAGAGNVTLTVTTGSVTDGDALADITATAASVTLADTDSKADFGASGAAINTAVSDLSVDTSAGNGDQYITEADGLTALNLNAGTGNVTLTVTAGSVTDSDNDVDVTASQIGMSAETGIGAIASPIQLDVGTVSSVTSATGGVSLNLFDPDQSGVMVTSITATTSGDIVVTSTEGGDGSGTFTFATVTAADGNIDLSANEGSITAQAISTAAKSGKSISIRVAQADKLLTHDAGAIVTDGGLITLQADTMALSAGTISSDAADVRLRPNDVAQNIAVGAGADDGLTTLGLTDTEINNITTTADHAIIIGDMTITGTISVVGAANLAGKNFSLETGSTSTAPNAEAINDGTTGGGGNLITGTNLSFKAAGGIDVSVAASQIAAQSTASGDIQIDEADAVEIGSFNGVTGITAASGNITLVAGNTVTLKDAISAGSGGTIQVTSSAGGIVDDMTDTVSDITTTGAVSLWAVTGIGSGTGEALDLDVGSVASAATFGVDADILLHLLDDNDGGVTLADIDVQNSGDIAITTAVGSAGTWTLQKIDTNAGNISVIATAGNIALTGVAGVTADSATGTAGTGAISLTAQAGLITISTPVASDTGAIRLTAQSGITLDTANADVTVQAGASGITIDADSDKSGLGSFEATNAGASLSTAAGGGTIQITAQDVNLLGTINSGSGSSSLIDSDGTGIGLGAATVTNGLNLSGAELQRITATGLTLQTAGSISVNGVTAAQSNNVSGTLTLAAIGDITFTTGASTLNALHANAGGNVFVNAAVTTDTGAITIDAHGEELGAIRLGANLTAQTSMDFNDDVLLTNDIRLVVGTNLTFHDTVDGSEDLVLDVVGATTFQKAVGETHRLGDGIGEAVVVDSSGATNFVSSLKTNSGISQFNDSGAITFGGDVDLLSGDTSSTFYGNVTLDGMTFRSARDVRFGNANTDLLTLSGGSVEIDTTGSGSTLRVASKVDGAANLILNTSDNTVFSAAVGSLAPIGTGTGAALTVKSTFPATTTFESTLATASGLLQENTAGQIVFKENVNLGAGDTATVFRANVQLDGLTLTSAGAITFGDSTTTDQVRLSGGAVTISTASAGQNLTFNAEVYGPQALTLNSGAGETWFNGAVGGIGALASLTTDSGAATYFAGGVISTSGDQTFHDPVVLVADATLSGSNVTFASTVNDDGNSSTASNLTVNASGTTRFNAEVGDVHPIDSITTDGSGTTEVNANVSVSGGTMRFNDDVSLTTSVELTDTGSTGITFAKSVTGAHDLTLNVAHATVFQGPVTIGDGFGPSLDIKSAGTTSFDSTLTTASGITQRAIAGMMIFRDDVVVQEGNTATTFYGSVTLDGLTFTSERDVIFGDNPAADTVTLSGGLVRLSTVTTGVLSGLPVTGGPMTFNAAVDGAQDLVLIATGAIQLNAAVGSTPLNSLTLTAKGALAVTHNITAALGISLIIEENDTHVGGDDITVSGTAQIHSTGGNIVLRAGDNVTLTSASPIEAAGTVSIVADYGDNDENSSTVTTVTIQGTVSGTSVSVSGGPDPDTFAISASGASGMTVDGAGFGDTYAIGIGSLAGAVTISDSGTSGIDAATVAGTAGSDAFDITATQVVLAGKQVNYGASLENLTVRGDIGADDFLVTPSTVTAIAINGEDPTTWPGGDTLTYRGPGTASSGTITQTGFASVTYSNIEAVAPVVNAGADTTVARDVTLNRSVFFTDPGSETWSARVNWGGSEGWQDLGSVTSPITMSHAYTADGSYTVTVQVTDNQGRVGEDTFNVTVTTTVTPPQVTGVFVRGSAWASDFINNGLVDTVSPAGYKLGYAIPVGSSAQLTDLPWININQIVITFSEDVNVDEADLALKGTSVAQYGFATGGFSYTAQDTSGDSTPDRFIATWTLSQNLAAEKVLIDLDGDGVNPVNTPITSKSSGLALDGEWVNGSDTYNSGNGTPGGDFEFRFNVLPGDVNRDGSVLSNDVLLVRNAQFQNPGGASYSIFYNVNGSGQSGSFPFEILVDDVLQVRNLQFTSLPSGPDPVGMPQPASFSVTSTAMASLSTPVAATAALAVSEPATGVASVASGPAAASVVASSAPIAKRESLIAPLGFSIVDTLDAESRIPVVGSGVEMVHGAAIEIVEDSGSLDDLRVDRLAADLLFTLDSPSALSDTHAVDLDLVALKDIVHELLLRDEEEDQDLDVETAASVSSGWQATSEEPELSLDLESLANDLAGLQSDDREQHRLAVDELLSDEAFLMDGSLFGGDETE
jgi:hypothetical protein